MLEGFLIHFLGKTTRVQSKPAGQFTSDELFNLKRFHFSISGSHFLISRRQIIDHSNAFNQLKPAHPHKRIGKVTVDNDDILGEGRFPHKVRVTLLGRDHVRQHLWGRGLSKRKFSLEQCRHFGPRRIKWSIGINKVANDQGTILKSQFELRYGVNEYSVRSQKPSHIRNGGRSLGSTSERNDCTSVNHDKLRTENVRLLNVRY
mmetsp:Transcript_35748/g.89697  ORF Transcript_35748/g.89697 Transcript_35748/m.89697 type:complete len:204 (-) Transcript_35748:336-947(-)